MLRCCLMLVTLSLAERLLVAHEAVGCRTRNLKRVTLDTTVHYPSTGAKLVYAATAPLQTPAREHGLRLRDRFRHSIRSVQFWPTGVLRVRRPVKSQFSP